MEGFLSFLAGLAIGGGFLSLATFATVESGWKTDCEKIGMHVSSSAGQKVYKCELVK